MPFRTRRDFLRDAAGIAGLAAASSYCAADASGDDSRPELQAAREFHKSVPVFLGYCVFAPEQFQASGGEQCDLEKLDAAGVRTFVASVGFGYSSPLSPYFRTGPRGYELAGPDDWLLERQLQRVDELVATIKACPRTRLITRAADLESDPNDNSIGVIVHLIGNNHTLDVATVDTFFQHGVRATHPALEYHNRWCSSQRGREAPVMTDFGRRVITRMNELGIAIDTAHASDESALAMIDASANPVSDSHTSSRDLVPQSRGLRDHTLQRLARSGGVIGVHFAAQFLSVDTWRNKYSKLPAQPRQWQFNKWVLAQTHDPDERIRLRNDTEAEQKFYRAQNLPAEPLLTELRALHVAKVVDLANLIDYLVALVGIDHVGLGPDVNGIDEEAWPADMVHIGQLPHLTAELLRRNYTEPQLRKILSDNWRRALMQCLP